MPAKKSTAKKTSAKKPGLKKATAKRSTTRRPAARKPAAKKAGAKKSASKKRVLRRGLAMAAAVAAGAGIAKVVATVTATCAIKTRGDVSRLVLRFIRSLGFPSAVEASDFTSDIVVAPNARRGWATPLRNAVSAQGCSAGTFGPDECSNAAKVGDIVDALAGAIGV
jgi:anti-sigma factor RsiW